MLTYPAELSSQIVTWGNTHIPDHFLYLSSKNDTEHGREYNIHTTIAYGFSSDIPLRKIKEVCGLPKIDVTFGGVSAFTHDPKFDVFKVDILSENLLKVRTLLDEKIGLPGNVHTTYIPHLTLAYVKKGKGDYLYEREFPFTGMSLSLNEYVYSRPTISGSMSYETQG